MTTKKDTDPNAVIAQLTEDATRPQLLAIKHDGVEAPLLVSRSKDGDVRVRNLRDDINIFRKAPEFRSGVALVQTLQSFIELVNRHKDGDSVIFADVVNNPHLVAVIDYHKKDGKPRFGKHLVRYQFPISVEWSAWRASNDRWQSQGEFAVFVEDRIADLAAPDDDERKEFEPLFQTKCGTPADIVTLSRGLQVRVDASVVEAVTVQSGEGQISFAETHNDGHGKKLMVPGLFIVNVPIVTGGKPVRFVARLRYRLREGRLMWLYSLYRWQRIVEEAFRDDLAIAAGATNLPAYEGSPEA